MKHPALGGQVCDPAALVADEAITYDVDEFVTLLESEYDQKWGCTESDFAELSRIRLEEVDGLGTCFDIDSLQVAFAGLRKHAKLDSMGISVEILWLFAAWQPVQAVNMFNTLSSNDSWVQAIEVSGHCAGKHRSPVRAEKTRCILPFPSLLRPIDIHCGHHLKGFLDSVSVKVIGYEECAKKGRQVMDIAWCQSMAIEKGLDFKSEVAVAQCDIKAFYCNLVAVLVHDWLIRSGSCVLVAATFIRLQLCPSMCVHVAESFFRLKQRSVGVFTGTHSAVQGGRIPLIDAAITLGRQWSASGFKYIDSSKIERSMGISSFVDNTYAAARQADTAVEMLESLEAHLHVNWMLSMGEDSKFVMQPVSAPDAFRPRGSWNHVQQMKTLGQIITNDSSVWPCVHNSIKQMWNAFYSNLSPGLLASPETVKCNFVKNSLMSICTWRWARWPYNVKIADKLDSVQSHFFQLLFPSSPYPNEDPDAFFKRVRQQSGRKSAKVGRFSSFWAGSIKKWHLHLKNAELENSWSAQIYNLFPLSELEASRTANSRGSKRDRTGTRAKQGHVHVRWSEGLELARGVASIAPNLPAKTRLFG